MRLTRVLAVALLALSTTACTTVIQPARVTTWHYQPAPVYVVPAPVHPEVYYFGYQAPVIVYRRHREYVPFYSPQWHRPYRW